MAFTKEEIEICTRHSELWLNSVLLKLKAKWLLDIYPKQELINKCILHSAKYWKPDKEYKLESHCYSQFRFCILDVLKDYKKENEDLQKTLPKIESHIFITPNHGIIVHPDYEITDDTINLKISLDKAADKIEKQELAEGIIIEPNTAKFSGVSRDVIYHILENQEAYITENPDLGYMRKLLIDKLKWKSWFAKYKKFRDFILQVDRMK